MLSLVLYSCTDEYGYGWQSRSSVSWDMLIRTKDTLLVTYPIPVKSDDSQHFYAPNVKVDYDTVLVYGDIVIQGSIVTNMSDYTNLYSTYQRLTYHQDVKILYYAYCLGSLHISYLLDSVTHQPIFDSINQHKLDSAFDKYCYTLPWYQDYKKIDLRQL